jgi:hypothetical protein
MKTAQRGEEKKKFILLCLRKKFIYLSLLKRYNFKGNATTPQTFKV